MPRKNRDTNAEHSEVSVSNGTTNDKLPVDPDDGAVSPDGSEAGVSSSLSEFDGSLDEHDKMDTSNTLAHALEEDNESEAETERLGRTPQKPWMTGETGRTPSKLSQHATYDDEVSDGGSTPTAQQRASVSPFAARGSAEIAGRKRKRTSPLSDAESSLSEESESDHTLAKRRTSHRSGKPLAWDPSARAAAIETVVEEADTHATEHDELQEDLTPRTIPHVKGGKTRRGRTRARIQKETTLDSVQAEEKMEQEVEDVDEPVEDEDEESSETLTVEEAEKREQASQLFTKLKEQFRSLRKTLHAERLAAAEAELVQLGQEYPNHPEYLAQLQTVTHRRDSKIRQEMKLLEYKKQALRNETLATRAQKHSQYFQEAREIRERILDELGKQWYDIQKERRAAQADELDRYTNPFPTKRSEQVRQQTKYNLEVSILSGIAKHVGFPAAPEIEGARSREMDDDFKAMKISRRQPYTFPYAPADYRPYGVPAPIQTSDHIAQKEFLEQTPWANPHHPVHQQSRTPSAFGSHPVGLQSSAAVTMARLGHGQVAASPFSTPMGAPIRNADQEPNVPGSNETLGIPSDPPSSAMAAPPTSDRLPMTQMERNQDGSPTAYVKRVPGQRRDFSGLSSTSTIDAPGEQSMSGDVHMPPLPVDSSAPNQAFATSAIHAQHGDDRKPEVYEHTDYRRAGGFGTPGPLSGGNMHGIRRPQAMDKRIAADAT